MCCISAAFFSFSLDSCLELPSHLYFLSFLILFLLPLWSPCNRCLASAPAPSNPTKLPPNCAPSIATHPNSAIDGTPPAPNPPLEIPPVPPPPPQLPASAAPTGPAPTTYNNPAQGECDPFGNACPPSHFSWHRSSGLSVLPLECQGWRNNSVTKLEELLLYQCWQ